MFKFFIDKQECYNPDKEHPFSYTNVKEVEGSTLSNNLLMVDFDTKKMFYTFMHDDKLKLSKSNKEHYGDMIERFFPIEKEDTRKMSYCEIDYNQLTAFLIEQKFGFKLEDRKKRVNLLKLIDTKIKKAEDEKKL